METKRELSRWLAVKMIISLILKPEGKICEKHLAKLSFLKKLIVTILTFENILSLKAYIEKEFLD